VGPSRDEDAIARVQGVIDRRELRMRDFELMHEIERYNEVDCRTMAELIAWLRANRWPVSGQVTPTEE
jgi:predicted RecB family nuclease